MWLRFFVEWYKDKSRLGKALPNPRIKHTKKTSSGTQYHFLTWEGEKGGQWYGDDFFKLAGGEDEELLLPEQLSCRTRKSRDKRICRWNGMLAFSWGLPMWRGSSLG